MGKTNTCDLREDEGEGEGVRNKRVRKHKCMYDKADKGYKKRDRTIERDKIIWQVTEITLGYEEGKNNGFKLNDFKHKKTHSRSSRQRYMQVFSCP